MKDILKYTLGCFLAMLIMGAIIFVSFLSMIAGMAAMDSTTKPVQKGSILHIQVAGVLDERTQDSNPFAALIGNSNIASQGLDQLKTALRVAADNDDIVGLYLEGGVPSADYACLQELHQALLQFKKSGKFIVSYADQYTQGAYYLCSVADKVLINPEGMIDWHGIASQPIFFKELLEKLGVKVQVFKVGTYKSAVEPYILTEMSAANREQVTSFITDIWQNIVNDVAKSRKLTAEQLNDYADQYATFQGADWYKARHLVDDVCYIDGTRDILRKMAKTDELHLVSPADVAALDDKADESDKVAIYYATGDIVDEVAKTDLFSQQSQIVGQTVVKDLDELANDDDVKAVVLRINSGGGSAYASEQMWHAIQLLKKKKPVVVSMSGMAASGGYYMSCGANYIFADATTLTGSIGIFGMVPDVSGLLTGKLGLHFDMVKTNKSADFGTMARAFTDEEGQAMQAYVERGYKLFLSRVAAGRHKTTAQIDSIGQGRVWTGQQALAIGLVDKLGTLEDAVAYAAKLAKVKKYSTADYPAPASWMDSMKSDLEGDSYLERKARLALGEYYAPLTLLPQLQAGNYLQARIPFAPNLK